LLEPYEQVYIEATDWQMEWLGSKFNTTVPTNNQTKPGGTIKRYGVGDTLNPPDTVATTRCPVKPAFFTWTQANLNGQQATIAHGGVENVTKIDITAIKITGIVGTPDVLAIRFVSPYSSSLKHQEYTSVETLPDDCTYVNISNAGTNYIQFGTPLVLFVAKDGVNLNTINVQVYDLTGAAVVYTSLYMWCMVHTMNWQ
jgi:hypothetical protein